MFFEGESKSVIEVDGTCYVLDGWNGLSHRYSREIVDFQSREIGTTLFNITPKYIELYDEFFDLDIESYDVAVNYIKVK